MRFAVLQENVKAALSAVLPAVGKGQAILETVKIDVTDRLTLTTTNLDMAIIARCAAKVEAGGTACVPAKLLSDIIAGLPNDRITLSLVDDVLTLQCAAYQTTIKVLDPEDFPTVPHVTARADIPLELLRQAAAQVVPAAATSDTRPALTGVHLTLDTVAQAEAADGYRVARLGAELAGRIDPALNVLVPAKTIAAAAKAFRGLDDDLALCIGTAPGAGDAFGGTPAQLLLDAGDIQVLTRLIDGTFPQIDAVIPVKFTTRVVVEARELRQAVVVAALYAARSAGVVKLQALPAEGDLGYGKVVLSANAAEVGESVVTLSAMVAGPLGQIALNAAYLADALAAITTPQVALELTTPQAPAVFRPVGADGYVHLIMPMMVR